MIRTRFAPSPTGFMHIGNLRTALYAYLIAKHENGKFLLRIEDTDQARFVEGSTDFIYKTLEQTGLIYDEGPTKDGGLGPYIQSKRLDIYKQHVLELVSSGGAYFCFCGKTEEIDIFEKKPFRCDCVNLNTNQIEEKRNEPHVIRQIIPNGSTTFIDSVYGEITVNNEEIENQVLVKADGYPTYNFANVVDDNLMGITHVIRGSEYLSSTPKYNLLYKSFGWDIPTYVHLPLIVGHDKVKLSKRNGDANFSDLIEEGYLPEAIINYIAMLGWSPVTEDNQEIFSLDQLIKSFKIKNIGKSPAVFDKTKLTWFNAQYIQSMDSKNFYDLVLPYLKKSITSDKDLDKISTFLQSRVEFATDVCDLVTFVDELPSYEIDLYTHKKMKTDVTNSLNTLISILPDLESTNDYTIQNLKNIIQNKIEELGVKNGIVLWPIRTALTGTPTSFCGAAELLEIFGKEESLKRIQYGIKKLKEIN